MIRIEVVSSGVRDVKGKKGTPNEGKLFHIPEVQCYAHLPGEKYPVRMVYTVPHGETAPPAGMYTLGPRSLYVDQFGNLQVRKGLELIGTQTKVAA